MAVALVAGLSRRRGDLLGGVLGGCETRRGLNDALRGRMRPRPDGAVSCKARIQTPGKRHKHDVKTFARKGHGERGERGEVAVADDAAEPASASACGRATTGLVSG